MPFTFAHPAIVLPLTLQRSANISASALIIGSITPDFEYFLRMKATGSLSHSLTGVFLLDLPLAVLLLILFHMVVKRPLINNLPDYFRCRLTVLRDFDFVTNFRKYFVGYGLCLLTGILSHIFWDGFTHARTLIVEQFPALQTVVDYGFMPRIPVYRYIQHISSIVGLAIIAVVFHRRGKHESGFASIKPGFWVGVAGVALVVFTVRASMGFEYLADVGAVLIGSALAGLVLISILISRIERNKIEET